MAVSVRDKKTDSVSDLSETVPLSFLYLTWTSMDKAIPLLVITTTDGGDNMPNNYHNYKENNFFYKSVFDLILFFVLKNK